MRGKGVVVKEKEETKEKLLEVFKNEES